VATLWRESTRIRHADSDRVDRTYERGRHRRARRGAARHATLKQRVRQLTTDNRTLDERLKAARSNLRFQDRRIADLEACLADPAIRPS
jgi:hypothetical protein